MFEDGSVLEAVREWSEEAAKAAASPLWPLPDAELLELLQAVHRTQKAMAALQARIVGEAMTRELPAKQGHRTVSNWLRSSLILDPYPARELAEAAAMLSAQPSLERAVVDGLIDLRQATVIGAAVSALPATLADASAEIDGAADTDRPAGDLSFDPDDVTARAESTLIEMAGQFPAYHLRRLGDRILTHVAPEIAERAEETMLRRAEERAHRRRSFTLSLPVDGMVRLSGFLGVEEAAIVKAALHPLCQPSPEEDRTFGQRRADALVDVCRLALRTGELPHDGGEPPQLAVTVRLDPLTAQLRAGHLPDGERVTAATTRRVACDARVLPFVLGGASQILDAGRSRRLAHGALRRALNLRDGGCAFPGCDRPARWCDAHHLQAWSDGGPTDLDNLVLLCRHHHRLLHDPAGGWQVNLGADRLPNFVPPAWTDREQRPRRNLYHPRT